jgi:hypothetical protein
LFGKTDETTKRVTAVNQSIGSEDDLKIKHFYAPGGKTIPKSMSKVAGIDGGSLLTNSATSRSRSLIDTHTKRRVDKLASPKRLRLEWS